MKRSARLARAPVTFSVLAGVLSSCTPGPTTSAASVVSSAPASARESNTPAPATPASCVIPPRAEAPARATASSVDGAPLATCSTAPMTGVYRDGRCATGPDDVGVHVVCAARWAEAAGVAPPVVLEATEARALHTIPRHDLDARALRGVKP